jgi:hypothetical protein
LKGQISLEYAFAVVMWTIVCTAIAFSIAPSVASFSSQSLFRAQASEALAVGEIASSDVDGLKVLRLHHRLAGNFTFNNTSATFVANKEEFIADFPTSYDYGDEISQGDTMLIKTQGDRAVVAKVG